MTLTFDPRSHFLHETQCVHMLNKHANIAAQIAKVSQIIFFKFVRCHGQSGQLQRNTALLASYSLPVAPYTCLPATHTISLAV